MKSVTRLFVFFTLIIAGSAAFAADEEPAIASKGEKTETELTKYMDKMNGAFRKLRRQAADATKNADSLEQVAILREYAASSAKLEPAKAAAIPVADRTKWVADYQAKMRKLSATIEKLDAAFKTGQNEEAVKIVADLNTQQRAGHKEYRSDEKK